MARRLPDLDPTLPPPFHATPACVCDACGGFGIAMHIAGSVTVPGSTCYHCGNGAFRHRALWRFSWCPACGGRACAACNWKGMVATPRE